MGAARFITFEGIDGSGKSTQLRRLAQHMRAGGTHVIETREPGGAPGAEEIRRLLVTGAPDRWSAETEILLFTAARRDHLENLIASALARGETVLCDRFADSTRVYQGLRRPELRETVDLLHERLIGTEPDLTLVLDLAPEAALARGLARGTDEDRFEQRGLPFQTALRAAFRDLARQAPERCRLIDASGDPDAVARRIAAIVDSSA